MFSKIKFSFLNYNKNGFLNQLLLAFLVYFIYSYFLKLNYVLEGDRDEIVYLSDSLLLLEGISPAHSQSPSGISTWLGSVVVLIDFIVNNFSFHSIESLFNNFDLTIFKHYQNLTYIKISLFVLNSFLLIYLYFLDKKKIFFLCFFVIYLLPATYYITFSGKPNFLGAVFFVIALTLTNKNKFLSLIFYALAVSEKWDFLLLINFICLNDNKISFKNYLIVFVIFFAVSPWFSSALIQNIKATLVYIIRSKNPADNDLLLILNYISIFGYLMISFTYSFFRNHKVKKASLLLLILSILLLSLTEKIPVRWLMPGIIVLVYELHFYLLKNEQLSKIGLILAVFLLLTNFNMQKFQSDDQILKSEINSSYKNVIGRPLLVEKLNFKNYNQLFGSYIKKPNIKNINFFKNDNAPLAFGKSGNIESRFHRRYEFLVKYNSDNLPNKYIFAVSGLYKDEYEWCSILNKKDTIIIIPAQPIIKKNCEDIS